MNFQQLNGDNLFVRSTFVDFCVRSKPYDFCSIKNPSVRMTQIKKYYEHLVKTTSIFYLAQGDRTRFFLSIKPEAGSVTIEFIFGDPLTMLEDFRVFREFYWQKFDCDTPFTTEIKRQHKLKPFLNFIRKKDKNAKISLDNGKILVSYSRNGAQK
jgi:hypothetical protein